MNKDLTNYETSKRLHELGFKEEYEWVVQKDGVIFGALGCRNANEYPAYTFSTIWEALPQSIAYDYKLTMQREKIGN